MSSPNEPGYPRAGDGAGGANGSAPGSSGPAHEGGSLADVPPWQRGPAGRARGAVAAQADRTPGAHGLAAQRDVDDPFAGPRRQVEPVHVGLGRPGAGVGQPARRAERPHRAEAGRPEAAAAARPTRASCLICPDQSPARLSSAKPVTERTTSEPASRSTATTSRVQAAATRHKGPVRASMQIRRVDPWSTLKVSLVLSVALFFVWMIAVAFLYLVLGGMGVWSKLNSNVGDLLTSASGSGGELVSSGTIFGGAALVGLVNIVLLTAMATAAAFIYNLTTDLVGGIEVTLADRD